MEGDISSLLDKTKNQESRIVELQKELALISTDFETTQQVVSCYCCLIIFRHQLNIYS